MFTQLSLSLESNDQLYHGFSLRMLVHILKEKLLVLWKLVLLEGRILIYSIKSSHVSSIMLALLSLFPG
jgi:hypothetical protein